MKTLALLAALCLLAVTARPDANSKWNLKFRQQKVTPVTKHEPLKDFQESFPKQPRVPGTKKVENCGVSSFAGSRIVGGEEAVPHSYPWQVALEMNGMWFCGGSIINEEYILTAGHCLDGAVEAIVTLGAHDLTAVEESQVTRISLDLTVHAGYNSFTLTNDLALLKLDPPITFNEYISPVCLPAYSTPPLEAGADVTATGWGYTQNGGPVISPVLNQVTNQVISNEQCTKAYGSFITDGTLCTEAEDGHGTCNGDSGGPVNYIDGGVTYTHGISSFVSSLGCESGFPDGFTRVTYFLDWIEEQTGIAIDP